MSDILDGAVAETGTLSIKPLSPNQAEEARRSVKLPQVKATMTSVMLITQDGEDTENIRKV
jgi:hypothetical protein